MLWIDNNCRYNACAGRRAYLAYEENENCWPSIHVFCEKCGNQAFLDQRTLTDLVFDTSKYLRYYIRKTQYELANAKEIFDQAKYKPR